MAKTLPTDAEARAAFGLEPKPETEPVNRADQVLRHTAGHDRAMEELIERHRDVAGGESHAQAADRIMRERPEIYEHFKAGKAAALHKAGVGNVASGGRF
jgi:hypothetical protein